MPVSGFVLAGGRSRRMGRDKALLEHAGLTLVEMVGAQVRMAVGEGRVSLLGDPDRYRHLGLPVIADLIPGHGPMSGLHAALSVTDTDWNLLAACDLPNLDAAFLRTLIVTALAAPQHVKCVAAESSTGLEPLCAVYHRSTRGEVELALIERRLRMRDLLQRLGGLGVPARDELVRNVNTVEDWRLHLIEKERTS